MKRTSIVALAAVAIAAALFTLSRTDVGQALLGRWSFTEWARVDTGTYFRLKVKLAYKGEPQDFDIVVGCNVHTIRYKDNSSTYEAGLTPTVYGRRVSDGKGLVIRPPDACLGQTTANGRVPTDFMPLILVYDDADKLGFGIAYASDEAYLSPLSVLTFGGATVEKATRAEFDVFREKGAPNLVSRASYFSNQSKEYLTKLGLEPVWPPFGRSCYAYARYKVPVNLRAAVQALWPAHRPEYWSLPRSAERDKLFDALFDVNLVKERDDGGTPPKYGYYGEVGWIDDRGILRVHGGRYVDPPRGVVLPIAPSIYPARSDISADRWPSRPSESSEAVAGREKLAINVIDVRQGAMRGFAYCITPPGSIIGTSVIPTIKAIPNLTAEVDGAPIEGASRNWSSPPLNVATFFERDEFYFEFIEFNIESTRGDV